MNDMKKNSITVQEVVWTDNQRNILLASGTDEQRIENGALLISEQKLLDFLAFAETFMAERYPREEFAFIGLDNSAPHRTSVRFKVQAALHPDEHFTVRVARDSEGGLSAGESYFNLLRRAELNRYVQTLFANMGIECVSDLDIISLTDVVTDYSQPLETLLAAGLELTVSGTVFARSSVHSDRIERAFCGSGVVGSFRLYEVTMNLLQASKASYLDRSFISKEMLVVLNDQKSEVK